MIFKIPINAYPLVGNKKTPVLPEFFLKDVYMLYLGYYCSSVMVKVKSLVLLPVPEPLLPI